MKFSQNDLKENIGLNEKEKIEFANDFLERFLEHGFGTMIKREMEILILKIFIKALIFSNQKETTTLLIN